jgi:hypothetical protein
MDDITGTSPTLLTVYLTWILDIWHVNSSNWSCIYSKFLKPLRQHEYFNNVTTGITLHQFYLDTLRVMIHYNSRLGTGGLDSLLNVYRPIIINWQPHLLRKVRFVVIASAIWYPAYSNHSVGKSHCFHVNIEQVLAWLWKWKFIWHHITTWKHCQTPQLKWL